MSPIISTLTTLMYKYLKLNTLLDYNHFYNGENYLFVIAEAFNN